MPALVLTTSLANGEDIGAGLIMAGFTLVVFVAFVLPWVPLEYRRMLRMLDEYEESLDPARA